MNMLQANPNMSTNSKAMMGEFITESQSPSPSQSKSRGYNFQELREEQNVFKRLYKVSIQKNQR